jgi:hypothetical protein
VPDRARPTNQDATTGGALDRLAVLRNEPRSIPRSEKTAIRKTSMLYKLGRVLQLVGMLIVPIAIAGNLVPGEPLSLGDMLKLAGVGVAVFALGWFLQQAGKRG